MDKLTLAFYYPWYWTKKYSGYWNMWDYGGKHNPDIFVNGNRRDISCPHYPESGIYDSSDPAIIKRHFDISDEAGIDAFIVSWWGHGNILNKPFGKILDYSEKTNTKVTIYYETIPSVPFKHEITALDLIMFIKNYGGHPGFLKTDNKPVIFFYDRVINEHTKKQWAEIIKTVKGESDALLIADSMDEDIIKLFDGAHTYTTFNAYLRRKNIEMNMQRLVSICRENRKAVGLTVMPGFDDTLSNNKRSLKRRIGQYALHFKKDVVLERNNGKIYSLHWEWAIKRKPDWILICSFNEWIEGTEIEPSIEYGSKYLDITKKYIKKFKQ